MLTSMAGTINCQTDVTGLHKRNRNLLVRILSKQQQQGDIEVTEVEIAGHVWNAAFRMEIQVRYPHLHGIHRAEVRYIRSVIQLIEL
jgi:hypothetical protein